MKYKIWFGIASNCTIINWIVGIYLVMEGKYDEAVFPIAVGFIALTLAWFWYECMKLDR